MAGGYVYVAWDASGNVLYVGSTTSIRARLSEHRRNARWGRLQAAVDYREFSQERTARAVEGHLICELDPPFNRCNGRDHLGRRCTGRRCTRLRREAVCVRAALASKPSVGYQELPLWSDDEELLDVPAPVGEVSVACTSVVAVGAGRSGASAAMTRNGETTSTEGATSKAGEPPVRSRREILDRRGHLPGPLAHAPDGRVRPVHRAVNARVSADRSTERDRAREPCPTSFSRRISTGRSLVVACCRAAHILRACSGSTRVSPSKTVNSTAGYAVPSL